MTIRKTLAEVRGDFDAALDAVQCQQQAVLIEENGQPVAALMTPEQFAEWSAYVKQRLFEAVRDLQARNADNDPDEVYRDVTAAVEEVRQERYEREQRRLTRDH
jgi:PHD/YefM family antitoxin component YafN of YafNO toxin-antitoxin module